MSASLATDTLPLRVAALQNIHRLVCSRLACLMNLHLVALPDAGRGRRASLPGRSAVPFILASAGIELESAVEVRPARLLALPARLVVPVAIANMLR